jgi:DNA-binding MarR family transcriptional regulator
LEPSPDQAVEQTVVAYRHFWTALLQSAEPIWSQLDLTISQLKGLILLEVREELSVGEIAEALGTGRPTASILVEQLVQLRLATRTEDRADRRRSLVCLTAEGKELAASLHCHDEEFMRGMFERLRPGELASLTEGLNALTGAMLASGT